MRNAMGDYYCETHNRPQPCQKCKLAAGSSAQACSVFHQTIRQMVNSGWRFELDLRTGFIVACHPMGGKQTICEIHGNSYIDKDRLGLGITKMLMALGAPNNQ